MKYAIILTTLIALQVTLRWDANTEPDLLGYELFARGYSDSYDYSNPIWTGSNTTCTVTVPDHSAFVLRAVDEAGNVSSDSNEAATWDGPPTAPQNCVITTVTPQ